MVPSEENQLVPKEAECAAEEPRVLCIIQDTTNSRTVNERVTLNLPASTPLRRLFADVAAKVGYENGSFDLVWGNGDTATATVGTEPAAPLGSKHFTVQQTSFSVLVNSCDVWLQHSKPPPSLVLVNSVMFGYSTANLLLWC
ncbi:ubiquitin carboxyl-terminal hydrolase 47-like [Melospiza georgiana]|uniref:ubiquitin carboxyl-terminal hydrolase 47-like n=1 Tax=Melospiza georgiana TaxID=44398 RepID=UPI0025AC90EC|nr:ubiquitin carboxyl-terminal hydrolase 47-like [Melospiza georgiana]